MRRLIKINAKQALDTSGTPAIIAAESCDDVGESKIYVWKKEKNQTVSQLKLKLKHTRKLLKDIFLGLIFLMTLASIAQNTTVSNMNILTQ